MDKLAYIRQSLAITSRAMEALRRAAHPGAAETELQAAVVGALEGDEAQWDLITGPRTAGIEGQATDRLLQKGYLILLDLSVKTGEYWTDVCRTFFLGKPGAEIRHIYAVILEAMAVNAQALRPGISGQEMYQTVSDCFAAHDMSDMLRHHTGHGVGFLPFQPPVELPGHQERISAGDVMTVKIGAYRDDRWGVRVENLYMVEEGGAQLLWQEPLSLEDVILEVNE